MKNTHQSPICLLLFVAFASAAVPAVAETDQAAKDQIFLEAILRIENPAVVQNPAIRKKLDGVLDRNRQSDHALGVIRKFALKERAGDLVDMAIARPTESVGVSAAKLALQYGAIKQFTSAITGKDDKQSQNALTVLGYVQNRQALDVLAAIIRNKTHSGALRAATVAALARSNAGETALVVMVEKKQLPKDLQFAAAQTLFASMDPKIKQRASQHLTMPTAGDASPLPPIATLVNRKGNVKNGPAAYTKAGCIQCHRIGDTGIDFGPNLSDIGNKLAKDGLYTAILDPSAGVEHNYEGYTVTTKDGTPLMGFIVSETDASLAVKLPGGITMTVKKKEVAGRKKMSQSLMPQGLQAALTTAELVDLVEYLSTCKVKKKP